MSWFLAAYPAQPTIIDALWPQVDQIIDKLVRFIVFVLKKTKKDEELAVEGDFLNL